jgi:hypothetical protein
MVPLVRSVPPKVAMEMADRSTDLGDRLAGLVNQVIKE